MKDLLQEWEQYVATFEEKPRIAEMLLDGGTPTFFSAGNLKQLLEAGRPFLRNIAMCLDARLWVDNPKTPVFSRSV